MKYLLLALLLSGCTTTYHKEKIRDIPFDYANSEHSIDCSKAEIPSTRVYFMNKEGTKQCSKCKPNE